MPVRITDLRLLEEFENYVTQVTIEARMDTLIMETVGNRLLNLQIEFTRLITEEPPDELPQTITINNYITSPTRNAKLIKFYLKFVFYL